MTFTAGSTPAESAEATVTDPCDRGPEEYQVDDEILPCPFCGCENVEEVMNDSLRSLECLNCHAHGPWVEDVIEDPAEAWNSRDSDSPFVVLEADYG